MNRPLLDKLTQLIEVDKQQSFDSQNPTIYRQRALLLQELGCNFLAMYDNRICAFLEKRADLEHYNHTYRMITKDNFEQCYQLENHTHYYQVLFDIVQNDELFLQEKFDPLNFALQAGNWANLGAFNLALRCNNDAIKHLKDYPQEQAIAYLNKGMLLNLVGEYEEGWKLYEKRWETFYKSFATPLTFPRPKWTGETLGENDVLLIHSEQGIGDNIQFIRYAIYLKQQGINILVWNNEHIEDFLSFNLARYGIPTAKRGDTVNFTYWIPMMSLPHLCGTTLRNIPFTKPYLTASPESLQKWEKQFPTVKKKQIGIVWQGGRANDSDNARSIPIETFADIFKIDAEFHILQKEMTESEICYVSQFANVHLWHTSIETFFDTSAIINHLDLVISVDTSVAHLSAAMGKTTWILVNYKPDFRWLFEGEKSVWYESIRLFRQQLDYNWEYVVKNVVVALEQFVRDIY